MKLILTLLVRDEEDIIRENILFHLKQGVDFIIATDNNSNDGTTEILREYERMGVLHYIFQPEYIHAQSKWVSHMARLACTQYNAEWVINSDADEFWWPEKGDLKTTLQGIPEDVSVVTVQRNDFIPRPESTIPFFERMIYKDLFSKNHLGKPLPPKTLHRAMPDVAVGPGNHKILSPEELKTLFAESIEIFHFPMRSYSQFSKKISQGGDAVANNPEFPVNFSKGWRTLNDAFHAGKLDEYYRSREKSDDELDIGLMQKLIVIDIRLRDFLKKHRDVL